MYDFLETDLQAHRLASIVESSIPKLIRELKREYAKRDQLEQIGSMRDPAASSSLRGSIDRQDKFIKNYADTLGRRILDARKVWGYFFGAYSRVAMNVKMVDGDFPRFDLVRDPFDEETFRADLAFIRRILQDSLGETFAYHTIPEFLKRLKDQGVEISRGSYHNYTKAAGVGGGTIIDPAYMPGKTLKRLTITKGAILEIREQLRILEDNRNKQRSRTAKKSAAERK